MPTVPIAEQSVAVQPTAPPEARIEPITPAASGANVAEGQAGIGKAVEEIGSRLEQHMVMQGRISAQQTVYERAQAYQSALQNAAYSEDPKNPGYLTRQGTKAQGAVIDFDRMTRGVPSAPGQPGQPPLKTQFMDGLSSYQQKMFERYADSHTSVFRGAIIKHEVQQTNLAQEATFKAGLDSQIGLGANVRDVHGLQTAQTALVKMIDESEHWKSQGHPDEITQQFKEKSVDEMVKNAVEANVTHGWQDAQKMLNASMASPTARAGMQKTIDGARIGQYSDALAHTVTTNPEFRLANGEIDKAKADTFVDGHLQTEKKNNGLPAGHDDAIMSRVESQVRIANSEIDQKKKSTMNSTGTGLLGAMQKGVPPAQAYDQFIAKGDFADADERLKAEELFKKIYERDPTAVDAVAEHWSGEQKQAFSQISASSEVNSKFGDTKSKQEFLQSLKQQIIEKRVFNRAGMQELLQQNLKTAPTGAPGILQRVTFGRVDMGGQEQEYYKTAAEIQKNQAVVRAMGNSTERAIALAAKLGGPGALAPDSPASRAVIALTSRGMPPEKIIPESIRAVIEKHHDWIDDERTR